MNRLLTKFSHSDIIKTLKQPQFFIFILSVIFSQIAFNMLNIVLIFLVYFLSGSNFFVSLIVLTAIIPQIFLSFIGGIIADKRNKKNILIIGNISRAIIVGLLFFYYDSLPMVFISLLVISIITQFYVPAEAPIIPRLVGKKNLLSANAVFGVSLFGSILIGYVFSGPAVVTLGRASVFLLLSGFFVAASCFAWFIPSHLVKSTQQSTLKETLPKNMYKLILFEFMKSIKLLRKASVALQAFLLLMISQVIILILAAIIPGYAESILKVKAEDLSLFLFAPAALGMIVSSCIVGSFLAHRNRNKIMNLGIFLSAAVLCLFPFTLSVARFADAHAINYLLPGVIEVTKVHIVIFLAFIAGVSNAFVFVPAQSTIQEYAPEEDRSKIYGLLYSSIAITAFVPIVLAGGIADVLGVGASLVTVGVIVGMIGIARIYRTALFK